MKTEAQATREYLEDRLLQDAISEGLVRRPMGFIDPPQLKECLYEQFVSEDPLAGAIIEEE